MEVSIPCSAAQILFIGDTEAPRGYNTVYGNNPMPKLLTRMTLDGIIADR